MAAIAASTSRVTSAVLASGNRSTTSIRLGAPSTLASPISGWWSSRTLATSPIRSGVLCSPSTATSASWSDVVMGWMCCTPNRWLGVSTNPPVPGVDASTKLSGDTQSALPVDSISSVRVTSFERSRSGSTWTCSCRSRKPQTETLATPGMLISRGRICQRARTDICIVVTVFDDMAIIATRLVDEVGWTIIGGVPTLGRALACVIRSWTI